MADDPRLKDRRLRFGIDVDGVLYQWDKTARYMLRTEFGYPKDGPLGQPGTYWNSMQDVVTKEHWSWLWNSGVKQGLFRYGHLYKGSIEALRELNKLGDIVIITHRPRSAVQDTIDWLSYMKFPVNEVHMFTNGEAKSTVKCDLYLDDKPENFDDFVNNTNGLPLLWRRPWNIQVFRSPFVETWEEVIVHARHLRR